ncbi:hypothetical protein DFH27DRAFT_542607 [Peziza echinospora]|nr:hypothetical protein DFH27DRAFT_542607 [Peziza echinospora]
MSGFPTLEEAFVLLLEIDPGVPVGKTAPGHEQTYISITGGTLTTVPSYTGTPVSATILSGGDWISSDSDGKRMRLDVTSLAKTDDGAYIKLLYNGIVTLTPALGLIFSGDAGASTTEFGHVVNWVKLQTGSPKYKELENGHFVGSGRFVVEKGKKLVVEYRCSRVVV